MNLDEIIFCGHMNESVCNLGVVIKAIEGLGSVELEFKKAEGRGMRSVDVVGYIDDDKFMIGQLMVQKEGGRGYIVREVTRWRDLSGDCCGEMSEGCDGCKIKDLEKMGSGEDDGWGGLINDGGWLLSWQF